MACAAASDEALVHQLRAHQKAPANRRGDAGVESVNRIDARERGAGQPVVHAHSVVAVSLEGNNGEDIPSLSETEILRVKSARRLATSTVEGSPTSPDTTVFLQASLVLIHHPLTRRPQRGP
jgi:hypothetical protein